MRTKKRLGILLFSLCLVGLAGCVKEEDDILKKDKEDQTVLQGKVVTSDGKPLSGIGMRMNYKKTVGIHYRLTRRKAVTQTDKSGDYTLKFYVEDDERENGDEDGGVYKYFQFIVDMSNLDSTQYILPRDMVSCIIAGDSLIGKPADVAPKIVLTSGIPERNKTYTENFYIPKKRYVKVSLKGFTPQHPGSHFEVASYFPWGGESDEADKMIDTPYGIGHSGSDMFVASSAEQTFEVPFALNENNIVRLIRLKDGVATKEEYLIYVTKNSPESLTYEY